MAVADKANEIEINEQESLLLAMYHALPMQYMRVVDLHNMLGGDSNLTTVRNIIHEKRRYRLAKKLTNTQESRPEELKHLRVLRMAVIHMLMCLLNLYEYAKKNLGPLRSTVGTVECALIVIVGPVCQKFKGVPDDFLAFLDTKVEEAVDKFDKHAPSSAKQVVYQAVGCIQKALEKTQVFVNEAQTGGLRTAIHYAATEYKQFLFNKSMKFWVGLEYQCPTIHTVAEKVTPAAAYLSKKYNQVVRDLTLKGYTIFGYVPLVPIDEISTALNRARQRSSERQLCLLSMNTILTLIQSVMLVPIYFAAPSFLCYELLYRVHG